MNYTISTSSKTRVKMLLSLMIATLAAVVIGSVQLKHIPDYDEFYHLLPAISWNASGTLAILDGEYTRASLFTLIVAQFIDWFGVSFEVSRLPSLIAGVILSVTVFFWVNRQAGSFAALIASLTLCITPIFVFSIGQTRFYMLHALIIFLASIAVYGFQSDRRFGILDVLRLITVVVLLLLALHLQITTLVAVAGMSLWLLIEYRIFSFECNRTVKITILATIIVALAAIAYAVDIYHFFIEHFMSTPLWSRETSFKPQYYIGLLSNSFGFIWALLPLFLWLGYRQENQRLLLFNGVMFTTVLIIHSFAAQKSGRYILYGLPYLAVLIGISLSAIFTDLRHKLQSQLTSLSFHRVFRRSGTLAAFALAAIGSVALLLDPTLRGTIENSLTPKNISSMPDWEAVQAHLKSLAKDRTVVTTEGVKAAYFLGNFDYDLNLSVADEIGNEGNLAIDPRTGRSTLGSADEMRRVFRCHPHGLIIADKKGWRTTHGVTDAVADLIEAQLTALDTAREANFLVFTWDIPESPTEDCE